MDQKGWGRALGHTMVPGQQAYESESVFSTDTQEILTHDRLPNTAFRTMVLNFGHMSEIPGESFENRF